MFAMDPVRNPFAPGAGTPPPELSGRSELLARAHVALQRIGIGRSEKGLMLVGLRGVGKTVLLNEIRLDAEALGFHVCLVEAHEGKSLPALIVPQLRRVLLDLDRLASLNTQVKQALRILKSFMLSVRAKIHDVELSLDIDPEAGAADSGDIEVDLPELMVAIGQAAQARETALGLFIDEIQYFSVKELSALIMTMHRIAQERLPVILFGAGLPQIVSLFGQSKSYAERLFDFSEIGPLDPADARSALTVPVEQEEVRFSEDAFAEIAMRTRGYPFFLQEWGYHAWNLAETSPITGRDAEAATVTAINRLDQGFFRVRFDRLTPREKDYLRAMAALGPGPHRSGEVARKLGRKTSDLGLLRDGLIGKGMIYSPAYGDIAFTVPLFDEFLHRIMPEKTRHG